MNTALLAAIAAAMFGMQLSNTRDNNKDGKVSKVSKVREYRYRPRPTPRNPNAMLLMGIGHGSLTKVQYWLAKGADANFAHSAMGSSPVLLAASRGNQGIVRELLANGADPNKQDQYGRSALHEAALAGDLGVVQELLAGGADTDLQDQGGETALDIAKKWGNEDVRKLLAVMPNPAKREAIREEVSKVEWEERIREEVAKVDPNL